MPEMLHQITIAADAASVYRALTTREGLAAWWTPDVEAEPHEGSTAVFGFGNRSTVFRMNVVKLDANREVQWICESDALPDWHGTRVCWEIMPGVSNCAVRFTHSGFSSPNEIFRACNTDWGWLMHALMDTLEGRGQGPLMR